VIDKNKLANSTTSIYASKCNTRPIPTLLPTYMLHKRPIALTPRTAPNITVTAVAGTFKCSETGPSQLAGSVSAIEVAGTVTLAGDARHAALYAASALVWPMRGSDGATLAAMSASKRHCSQPTTVSTVAASQRHASFVSPHAVIAAEAGAQEVSHDAVSVLVGKARNCDAGMAPAGAARVMFRARTRPASSVSRTRV